MDILILLADLALTVFVYCSPAAAYRFLIKKEPAEKKLARNFCIISSVIVYLLLLVIYLSAGFDMVPNVAAAAIWGFVSYRILLYEDKTKGKITVTPLAETEPAPVQLSIFDQPEEQPANTDTQPENNNESPIITASDSSLDTSSSPKKIDFATVTILGVLTLLIVVAIIWFIYILFL